MKVNAMSFAKMVAHLLHTDATVHEVSEVTGLHIHTVSEYVRAMHKERAVHICGWIADRLDRDTTAVWRLGAGTDKRRRKMTQAQRQARYRAAKARKVASVFQLGEN